MKLLLCAFERLVGLKINFHKSDVMAMRKIWRTNIPNYLVVT
jgi:hypothetical protein